MNIADIRLIYESKGLGAAIEELRHYPECSAKLKNLIFEVLKDSEVGFNPGLYDEISRHHYAVLWLKNHSETHDIQTVFENWLTRLEDGFWLPSGPLERLAVLCDLVKVNEPVFEFGSENLTPEQRFLVDFGFAQITRDEPL